MAAVLLAMLPSGVRAQASAVAGSIIRNVADASYTSDGRPAVARSNAVATRVDERLDVTLALRAGPAGGDPAFVAFRVTNRGNGIEAFVLTAPAVPAGLVVRGIARDADDAGAGDGRPDAGGTLDGGITAPIAAGDSAGFVLILTPAADGTLPDGTVTIAVRAATGSGTPGTVFAGTGDGGGDAVTGPTGAAATLTSPVGTGDMDAMIEKSQAVRAPDGSPRGVPGATITYTLRARAGVGARAVRIADPIPSGTRYVPGSLRLDDAAVSDADDADPGGCDGARVTVALPDGGAGGGGTIRTISFQVIIQ